MTNEDNWIEAIIPKIQVDSMEADGDEIVRRTENGVSIVMSISHAHAVEFCQLFRMATERRDRRSSAALVRFVSGIVEMLEASLAEANINPYD